MNAAKKQRLEDAGFRVGTPADFLQLSTADCELIELRLLLDAAIRELIQVMNAKLPVLA